MFGRRKKKKERKPIPLDATAQYVGFWYRAAAALLDAAVMAAVAAPIILVAAGGFEEPGPLHGIVVVAVWFFYTVGAGWWKSRTLGLWLISSLIVDVGGSKPKLWQFIVRFFGILLSLLPAGLGLFWIGFGARHRGWHDRLARTAVIGDETFRPLTADDTSNLADTVDWNTETSH